MCISSLKGQAVAQIPQDTHVSPIILRAPVRSSIAIASTGQAK
jgi:hypothetical protein